MRGLINMTDGIPNAICWQNKKKWRKKGKRAKKRGKIMVFSKYLENTVYEKD